MTLNLRTYRNSTQVATLSGVSIYIDDIMNAALRTKLNVFLQGDTGSGKTQLARDIMAHFGAGIGDGSLAEKVQEEYRNQIGSASNIAIDAVHNIPHDKTLFILGRNDMDTRELFQQINLGKLYSKPTYKLEPLINPDTGEIVWYYPQINENGVLVNKKLTKVQADRVKKGLEDLTGTTEDIRELTSKINTNIIVVDEIPNCVPAVRAQLFNLFDGFIEINGKPYQIGGGYSVGIATGNLGQQFTESSNDLGRALKDRMHIVIDTDYFRPQPIDILNMLVADKNPRVRFDSPKEDKSEDIIELHRKLTAREVPFEKYVIAMYLTNGLDWAGEHGSKIAMKSGWPNKIEGHDAGSDIALILPVSPRAVKSIISLSQALDDITQERGATEQNYFDSMMLAFKLVGAYSGILNEAAVRQNYGENHYKAMDAVIDTTRAQFYGGDGIEGKLDEIVAGIKMASDGKKIKKILDQFSGRWVFMKSLLERLAEKEVKERGQDETA